MFDKIKDPVFLKEVREGEKYALLRKKYKELCNEVVKEEPLNCKFSKFRLFAEKVISDSVFTKQRFLTA